ncbi:hypothetical protein JCM19039_4645 [Geomicrobium sp. JCM 19039]|nr:hypothetical protein JCM19039_4645 [Geomicrobium sp. JCM 19039]
MFFMLHVLSISMSMLLFAIAYLIGVKKKRTLIRLALPHISPSALITNKEEYARVLGLYTFLTGIIMLLLPTLVLFFGGLVGALICVALVIVLVFVLLTKIRRVSR